jgi:Ni,Fe-hydrogenase III small subunit/formate hydrogenlyase subunit 6/NADH:ubiquinone oxidoreductase subunit I
MFGILINSLKTGVITETEPLGVPASFGFPVIDFSRCTACDECARACPTGAIQSTTAGVDRKIVTLSYAACIQCRACVTECPEQAVSVSHAVEVAAYTREQLARSASFEIDRATGRGTFVQVEAHQGLTLHESAERLRDRIRGRLGRSLHVRQVDAGSCNACEMEIAATTNPLYDLERFGVHLVASPRHADLLLVTGPVTRNMEIALQRTYDATPEPRIVVAVGACGCSGGIFGEGTYAAVGGVDRVLPVDVYIPGCPPRPQAILNGLLVAMGIREARIASGVANDATGRTP